jgi:hypothetical protein
MYGLNKNEDLEFLLNRTLEQVCIGKYDAQMNFHEWANISFMGAVTIDGHFFESPREAGPFLLKSLGSSILKLMNPGDGNLTIIFSSGQTITLNEDNQHHESYNISSAHRNIIV